MRSSNLVKDVLKEITTTLNPHIPRASREAQLLLMAHLQKDELWLITNQNAVIENLDKYLSKNINEHLRYTTQILSYEWKRCNNMYKQINNIPKKRRELDLFKSIRKI